MSAKMRPDSSFSSDRTQEISEVNPAFEALLDYLKHSRGCDLTSYKRSSLMRRFQHRMQSININTFENYLQYLQWHIEEYFALLDNVLINVTSFFRDRETWDYLAEEIVPKLIASKQPEAPIRVWSAGCATGQEIFSILILLAEALGIETCLRRVQCYATDADASALAQAREATYSHSEITGIHPDWLEKYFERTETGYMFHPRLRRNIVFSQHDLTQDAPISKIDLLVCRNVLIYFNSEAQAPILARFHFVLNNTGFLVLGKAEALMNHRQIFKPVNLNQRIYTKGVNLELADYLSITPKPRKQQVTNVLLLQNYFWEAAFEASSFALIAIDADGYLHHANEQARGLFGLTFDAWKRHFQELEPAKLISADTLKKALLSNQNLTVLKNIEWRTKKGSRYFEINISRVLTIKKHLLGAVLAFIEIPNYQQVAEELQSTQLELTRAYQALAETKATLSMAYQELESTQKELDIVNQQMSFTQQDRQNSD